MKNQNAERQLIVTIGRDHLQMNADSSGRGDPDEHGTCFSTLIIDRYNNATKTSRKGSRQSKSVAGGHDNVVIN